MHPEPSSEKRITCGGNQCPDSMHHFPNPDPGKKGKAILRFLLDLLNLNVDKMHPEPSSEERISCGGDQCPNSMFRFLNPDPGKKVQSIQIFTKTTVKAMAFKKRARRR